MYYNYKKLEKESRDQIKDNNNENNISLIYKFKIAIYCFILFILLSNKNTYKIIDIIIKTFRRDTNDIID